MSPAQCSTENAFVFLHQNQIHVRHMFLRLSTFKTKFEDYMLIDPDLQGQYLDPYSISPEALKMRFII